MKSRGRVKVSVFAKAHFCSLRLTFLGCIGYQKRAKGDTARRWKRFIRLKAYRSQLFLMGAISSFR